MKKQELSKIIDLHEKWLSGDPLGVRANLSYADLSGANLSGADLSDADLWSCVGNKKEIKSIFCLEPYSITYAANILQIGCQRHSIDSWRSFSDNEIKEMDGEKALTFWVEWKDFIFNIIEKYPATKTGHEVK